MASGLVFEAAALGRPAEGTITKSTALTAPNKKTNKTYWVQVEGEPSTESIQALCKGVELKDGLTLPANVKMIEEPNIWQRTPPVRERKSIPVSYTHLRAHETDS